MAGDDLLDKLAAFIDHERAEAATRADRERLERIEQEVQQIRRKPTVSDLDRVLRELQAEDPDGFDRWVSDFGAGLEREASAVAPGEEEGEEEEASGEAEQATQTRARKVKRKTGRQVLEEDPRSGLLRAVDEVEEVDEPIEEGQEREGEDEAEQASA